MNTTENRKLIEKTIASVTALNTEAMEKAKERQDMLAKPPGSLGVLEDISIQLAGIRGDLDLDVTRRAVVVLASDNGVVEEGVASAPQSVTMAQTLNFTKGITGVAVLAKRFGADLIIADMGINADISHPMIRDRKIRKGTSNLAKGPAMSREECEQAIAAGIELVRKAAENGYKLLGVGEMGIGNTTTSACVLCALTDLEPVQTIGKGAGLTEDAYRHKIEVVKTALTLNKPDKTDPVDIIAKVGGFDIAAMVGVYLGSASVKIPVVIDGFISIVAALAAAKMCPLAREYMLASHASFEQGFKLAEEALDIKAPLNLGMRLGEGSGCPIMFAVVDAACDILRDMGTFGEASIDDTYLEEIRGGADWKVTP